MKFSTFEEKCIAIFRADVDRIPLLTHQEEKDLYPLIRKRNKDAIRKLVEGNLRYAYSVAGGYFGILGKHRFGSTKSDIICDACSGAVKAAHRFDPDKGFRFITYAVWYTRREIENGIWNNSPSLMRVPASWKEKMRVDEREQQRIYMEVFEDTGSKECADMVARELKSRIAFSEWVSLDTSPNGMLKHESNDGWDRGAVPVDQMFIDQDTKKRIAQALTTLSTREQDIVVRVFGLNGQERETYSSVSLTYNLSRERVRQILEAVLARFRSRPKFRDIQDLGMEFAVAD